MRSKSKSLQIERPLSVREAAAYLGVTVNTIYSYCFRRLLKYYKVNGRHLRFKQSDLADFVFNDRNKVSTKNEPDSDDRQNYATK
jgi:excisionase family DNA binding protein